MPFDALSPRRAPYAPARWRDPFEPRLFTGHVMHLRTRPARHQFRYSVVALWLDADAPEAAAKQARLLRIDRFGVYSFHRKDHGARDGSELRPFVEAALAGVGAPPPARIMLLSFPRLLGYVFNPLSVYYCYDETGVLESLVYQVKNTIGEQHAYAARLDRAEQTHRHEADKNFYVSPFIDMQKRYNFTVTPPSDRLSLLIKQTDGEGLYLSASWNGRAGPLNNRQLMRRFLSHPLLPQKVIASIYFEAIRLRLKGVRMQPQPKSDKETPPLAGGST